MRTLFINGTVGVGKTTTAAAVSRILSAQGRPHAVIDTDSLRDRYPTPVHDPFDLELELRNLAAVSANYRQAGCELLIVAGVIEDPNAVERYCAATGVPSDGTGEFFFVRLIATPQTINARICARHMGDEVERDWYLERAPRLASILEQRGLGRAFDADKRKEAVAQAIMEVTRL
ncbi:uncharacterized protein EHS24_004832 [Apiotrichum porosum]|jgi:hypothetical protein|uniref:CobQ/CobB/MinD/ParA nucleotide binding domain-containing protein n=1 Tax=Apiotrichum porosum TaxID=105984 RepID=A0A427Y642_9TREE|nr:uncharacterized protein EHS24_004832 [Apiotrichum porosum]RSH86563.1 hypothetical protein EHS24_004832 [Apiotrichum porosum]